MKYFKLFNDLGGNSNVGTLFINFLHVKYKVSTFGSLCVVYERLCNEEEGEKMFSKDSILDHFSCKL